MTLNVTHAFVSGVADDPTAAAAGEVLPSHWNANHVLTGAGGGPSIDTAILYDKAGVIGEDTNLEWDYTNHILSLGPNARLNSIGTTWRFDVGGTNVLDYSLTTSNVWSFSSGVTAQGIFLYNTTDGIPTNYERGVFDWTTTSNVLTIGTQKGGSGSVRNIQFVVGGTNRLDYGISFANEWTFTLPTGGNGAVFSNATQTLSFFVGQGGASPAFDAQFGTVSSGAFGFFTNNNFSIVGVDASGNYVVDPTAYYGFSSSTIRTSISKDAALGRSIARTIALADPASLTSGTGFHVYNTTDTFPGTPTNYERGVFDWTTTSNVLTIGTQAGGTGKTRPINIIAGDGSGTTTVGSLDFNITNTDYWTFKVPTTGGQGLQVLTTNCLFQVFLSQNANVNVQIGNGGAGPLAFYANNGSVTAAVDTGGNFTQSPGQIYGWSSTNLPSGISNDTGISRIAPVSSVSTIAIGNGTAGDASATIKAKTKAGAPTASDVPAGTWVLIRDTTNATTKLYYNNAGTLQTVALV